MDRTSITKAFKELRKKGYFAQQNFLCCGTCAVNAIPDEYYNRFVYYHAQDYDCLKETGETHIGWAGDGLEICEVLNKYGLKTEWDFSERTRIKITLPTQEV
jgi:hypothetical protein